MSLKGTIILKKKSAGIAGKEGKRMPKKIIIGFQVNEEFKDRVIKAGKDFKSAGVPYPLNLSGFCRIAVESLLIKIENERGE